MKYSFYNILVNDEDDIYLANTFSGAVFKIDRPLSQLITQGNIDDLSSEDYESFKKTDVIIGDEIEELRVLSYRQNTAKFHSTILSLTILLTSDCNFRCTYCFEGLEKKATYLSETTKNRIFKFIQMTLGNDSNIQTVSITLFGGEPLMKFECSYDFLSKIQNLCAEKNKKFVTSIVTNGALITESRLEKLNNLNCSMIQITLDGTKEIHDKRRMDSYGNGTFETVANGIRKVIKYGKLGFPVIRINIDRTNLDSTFELLNYLARESFTQCYIDFGIIRDANEIGCNCNDACFSDEELGEVLSPLWNKLVELNFPVSFANIRRAIYCGLCSDSTFTIDSNGDIYKCWEMVGQEAFKIGQLDDSGAIINISGHFFDWMSRGIETIPECKECKYLPICGCGCASVSYHNNKSLFSKGCFKTKSLFEKKMIMQYKTKIGKAP